MMRNDTDAPKAQIAKNQLQPYLMITSNNTKIMETETAKIAKKYRPANRNQMMEGDNCMKTVEII